MDNPSLAPGASFELPFVLRANKLGEQELTLLLTFREVRRALPRTLLLIVDATFLGRGRGISES
jgi:hypothetical protein